MKLISQRVETKNKTLFILKILYYLPFNMKNNCLNKKPPDGGYGWVIAFANGLSNFITVPLVQCFGLIFKDTFIDLGLSATQGSVIINLNGAFGLMTGLINGLLLKIYGYRKVAVFAAFLLTVGVIFTSFADNFSEFIISYGLVTSLGMGMNKSAYGLALNTYFEKNRNRAMSFAVTFTGFGPILIPQLIRILMKFYTAQGVTLIFGGICAHAFISAILLQPVKWYMKEEETDDLSDNKTKTINVEIENLKNDKVYVGKERKNELDSDEIRDLEDIAIVYGSNPVGLENNGVNFKLVSRSNTDLSRSQNLLANNTANKNKRTKPLWKKTLISGVKIFDLDLLKDPIFVNIILGLGLAVFAELNFSVLTPFILYDFGLNTDQIATFLSTLGVTDIIFRFLAPYIGEYFNKSPRLMYVYSLLLLIITRFSLLISDNFYTLMFMALGLGLAKGIRKVYMGLIVPSHVTLDKLPSASGMEMMVNGLCILIGGPLLGVIRDVSGSYTLCIVAMNCVTFTTILLWTFESIIIRYKRKR